VVPNQRLPFLSCRPHLTLSDSDEPWVFISFGCTNEVDFGSALRSFFASVLVCPLQEVKKVNAKSKEQIDVYKLNLTI
jgi:hypothetical protein